MKQNKEEIQPINKNKIIYITIDIIINLIALFFIAKYTLPFWRGIA